MGLGGGHWLLCFLDDRNWTWHTSAAIWRERALFAERELARMTADTIASEKAWKRERAEMFTLSELNRNTEKATTLLRDEIARLKAGILQVRNLSGLLLGVNFTSDINTAWHELEKKSSQSIEPNAEAL